MRPVHEEQTMRWLWQGIPSPRANSETSLLVTTDDRLIKKIRKADDLPVMLPGEALAFLENWYEN